MLIATGHPSRRVRAVTVRVVPGEVELLMRPNPPTGRGGGVATGPQWRGTLSHNKKCRGIVALVVACAVVGPLLTAGPASAHSRGYQIFNFSSNPLKLERVDQVPNPNGGFFPIDFEGQPKDGAVLKPGAPPHDWELKYAFFGQGYAAGLVYSIVGTDSRYVAIIKSNGLSNNSACKFQDVRTERPADPAKVGSCTAEGLTLTVTDPPGTMHDIPAGDTKRQADTLRELCNKTTSASCEFTYDPDDPTKETQTNLPSAMVGKPIDNCLNKDTTAKFSDSHTVGTSNSFEVDVGAEAEFTFANAKAKTSITLKNRQRVDRHEDVHAVVAPPGREALDGVGGHGSSGSSAHGRLHPHAWEHHVEAA